MTREKAMEILQDLLHDYPGFISRDIQLAVQIALADMKDAQLIQDAVSS